MYYKLYLQLGEKHLVDIIGFISILIFFGYLIRFFAKFESHQLSIGLVRFNKIPNLLLKLAKIEKNRSELSWEDLDKAGEKKLTKYTNELMKASTITLTFLDSQNLIYVQLPQASRNYFMPIDKDQKELVHEIIGKDEDTQIGFVVHRQTHGWFKSPMLTGYIKKEGNLVLNDEKKEINILFEFPEALVRRNIFTKRLRKKYGLEQDEVADFFTDDLGQDQHIYYITYDQKHNSGTSFSFQTQT